MKITVFPIYEGMKVIANPIGNAEYYHGKAPYIEGIISKIARKYFYVQFSSHRIEKFDINTFESKCDDCNANYILYESIDEFTKERDRVSMFAKIRDSFSWVYEDKLTYEQINQIYRIIFGKGFGE